MKRPSEVDIVVGRGQHKLNLAELMAEMTEISARGRDAYVRRARDASELYNGVDANGDSITRAEDNASVSAQRNHSRGLCHTWSARLNEDRSFPYVWPRSPRNDMIAVSAACNAILKHARDMNEYDLASWEWSIDVLKHGAVGVLPYFDPDAGPEVYGPMFEDVAGVKVPAKDPKTGEPLEELLGHEGEVRWRSFAPCDYDYGPVLEDRTMKMQDWLRVRVYITKPDAMSMLDKDDNPAVGDDGMVCLEEYWHRPTARIPKGLHAVVVGGIVTEHGDWDLPFREIPFAQWGLDRLPKTRYFCSPFHDVVHLQRMINLKEEAKKATVKRVAFPILAGTDNMVDQVDSNAGGPRSARTQDFNEVSQGIRWVEPPTPQEIVFRTQDDDVAAMHDVMGLNEVITGRDSAKAGTSARQIAYLNYLDSQKLSGSVRARESFDRRLSWLTLELYRKHSDEERRVRLYGPGREYQDHVFVAADLDDGYDIVMEPVSGRSNMRAEVANNVAEDMKAGAVDPVEGMERAQTGLGESTGSADERDRAQRLGESAAAGQPAQVDPTIRPFVALEVLRAMKAAGAQGLDSLIAGYTQMQSQAGAAGPGAPLPPQEQP